MTPVTTHYSAVPLLACVTYICPAEPPRAAHDRALLLRCGPVALGVQHTQPTTAGLTLCKQLSSHNLILPLSLTKARHLFHQRLQDDLHRCNKHNVLDFWSEACELAAKTGSSVVQGRGTVDTQFAPCPQPYTQARTPLVFPPCCLLPAQGEVDAQADVGITTPTHINLQVNLVLLVLHSDSWCVCVGGGRGILRARHGDGMLCCIQTEVECSAAFKLLDSNSPSTRTGASPNVNSWKKMRLNIGGRYCSMIGSTTSLTILQMPRS